MRILKAQVIDWLEVPFSAASTSNRSLRESETSSQISVNGDNVPKIRHVVHGMAIYTLKHRTLTRQATRQPQSYEVNGERPSCRVFGLRSHWAWIKGSFALLLVSLSACSMPLAHREVGVGYFTANPREGRFHKSVIGIDLQAKPAGGITVGFSDVTLLNPSINDDSRLPLKIGFVFPFAYRWLGGNGDVRTLGWAVIDSPTPNANCSFLHTRRFGLSSRLSPSHQDLNLGVSNVALLTVDPNLDEIYRLQYRSRDRANSLLERIEH